jgi:hypothetical protein
MYTGTPTSHHLPPSDGDGTAQVTERRHEAQCQKTHRGARAVCPWQTEDASLVDRFLSTVNLSPLPLGGGAPPARCGAGGARLGCGSPPLTTRGRRRAGW